MTDFVLDDLSALRVGGDAAPVSDLAEAASGRARTAWVTAAAGRYAVRLGAGAAAAGERGSEAAVLVADVHAQGNAVAVAGPAVTAVAVAGPDAGGAEQLWWHRDARAFAPDGETEGGSRIEAELGYGCSILGGRAVATPWAGLTRSETDETWRLGQRLKVGASEWSIESAFSDESRAYGAGYRYGLGDALELTVDATRREAASDDGPENEIMLRAGLRW